VLSHIGVGSVRRLSVYNKCDKDGFFAPKQAVCVSAEHGEGMDVLKTRIQALLFPPQTPEWESNG